MVGSWGSESGECGSWAGKQVSHLFFQLVWTVPEPMKSAGVGVRVGHWEDDEVGGLQQWNVSWVTESREWGSPTGRKITHTAVLLPLVCPALKQ